MAILDKEQLTTLRQALARKSEVVDWDKSQINAASQAAEDWFEANKSGIADAINSATSPFAFTGAQKKSIVASFMKQKAQREGT